MVAISKPVIRVDVLPKSIETINIGVVEIEYRVETYLNNRHWVQRIAATSRVPKDTYQQAQATTITKYQVRPKRSKLDTTYGKFWEGRGGKLEQVNTFLILLF